MQLRPFSVTTTGTVFTVFRIGDFPNIAPRRPSVVGDGTANEVVFEACRIANAAGRFLTFRGTAALLLGSGRLIRPCSNLGRIRSR